MKPSFFGNVKNPWGKDLVPGGQFWWSSFCCSCWISSCSYRNRYRRLN
jgi:Asp-tRNAAsn/Glu-tRNAGln amidotransferase A subunit and related amidases